MGNTRLQIKGAPAHGKVSPPLLQDGEDGDVVQDPIEEVASGEGVLSHPKFSPEIPFRFRVTSRLH